MKSALLFVAALFFLSAVGCKRDAIQTYRVPKETPSSTMSAGMGQGMELAPAGTGKGIEWKVPPAWKEQSPSSMRIGSFLIKGENGQQADMSVVPLSGEAGGDLANINRWRGQINLKPISESDLSAQSESIRPGGLPMRYVDFVSQDLMIDHRYKKRLIAAIYHDQGRILFFKMIGEDATVLSAKPAFMKFLRSVRFPTIARHD